VVGTFRSNAKAAVSIRTEELSGQEIPKKKKRWSRLHPYNRNRKNFIRDHDDYNFYGLNTGLIKVL
jgi:hypothetical protein